MVATEQTLATGKQLDMLSINTIRTLAMDGVQQANSGHPGAPMALGARHLQPCGSNSCATIPQIRYGPIATASSSRMATPPC